MQEGLQRFSDDPQLLALEAEYRELVSDNDRAETALIRAFELNVRREFIAVRLARHFIRQGKTDDAKDVLSRCIDANPSAKFAHFELARFKIEFENENRASIIDHLRRSTTQGDSNYLAQYQLAHQLFLSGEEEEAFERFEILSNVAASIDEKNKNRDRLLDENGIPIRIDGEIGRFKDSYCFVKSRKYSREIFCHYNGSDNEIWKDLREGQNITFEVNFTFRGPVGVNLDKND